MARANDDKPLAANEGRTPKASVALAALTPHKRLRHIHYDEAEDDTPRAAEQPVAERLLI